MEDLPILYQDPHLVAINKPSGLLVHRSDIDRYETQNAMARLRNQLSQWVYPIHRLDKPTSGVLLFALDSDTARLMGNAFEAQQVSKTYLAIVRGVTKESELIDYPLQELRDKLTDSQAAQNKPAQAAKTEYRRLATIELPYSVGRYPSARFSLLRITPSTGRRRQIRRHLKHIFHPIIGDTSYGDGKQNRLFREHLKSQRLLLHAHQIDFTQPHSGQKIQVQAPLDETLERLVRNLDWIPTLNAIAGFEPLGLV